jgi:hypothetical protein
MYDLERREQRIQGELDDTVGFDVTPVSSSTLN